MEWFSEYAEVSAARRDASPENRFQAFTLTANGEKDIQAEIGRVKAAQVEEEKKDWAVGRQLLI